MKIEPTKEQGGLVIQVLETAIDSGCDSAGWIFSKTEKGKLKDFVSKLKAALKGREPCLRSKSY